MAQCFAWCWSSASESKVTFDPSQKPKIVTLTSKSDDAIRKVPSRDTLHSPDLSPMLKRNGTSESSLNHRSNGTHPSQPLLNGKHDAAVAVAPPSQSSASAAPAKPQFCFPPPEPPPPPPAPAPLLHELAGLSQAAKDRELYDAAWDGDESRVEHLLAVGASPSVPFTRRKLTAVMACARAGNEKILDTLLVAAPLAVNVKTRDGDTALHKAFEEQRIKAAGLLLRAGADPHIQNEDGVSAMGIARFRCPEEYQELVSRYGECKDDLKLVAPSAAAAPGGGGQEEIDTYNAK
jgi:hypothetical protein